MENNLMEVQNKNNMQLIKDKFAKGANQTELGLLLFMSKKYNLDILTGQIFLIKYGNAPASIFTSRDGFLQIAHRSGKFDGMETDTGTDQDGVYAICKVYRNDMKIPFSVKVYLKEYYRKGSPGKMNIWDDKPKTMLCKVAESQALRKAFEISGLYDPDEMPVQRPPAKQKEKVVSVEQRKEKPAYYEDLPPDLKELIVEYNGILKANGQELTANELENYCTRAEDQDEFRERVKGDIKILKSIEAGTLKPNGVKNA